MCRVEEEAQGREEATAIMFIMIKNQKKKILQSARVVEGGGRTAQKRWAGPITCERLEYLTDTTSKTQRKTSACFVCSSVPALCIWLYTSLMYAPKPLLRRINDVGSCSTSRYDWS